MWTELRATKDRRESALRTGSETGIRKHGRRSRGPPGLARVPITKPVMRTSEGAVPLGPDGRGSPGGVRIEVVTDRPALPEEGI